MDKLVMKDFSYKLNIVDKLFIQLNVSINKFINKFGFKRNEAIKFYENKILSKKLIKFLKKKYKNYWIIMPLHCIGDFLVVCNYITVFKKKFNGKVVIIVKDSIKEDLAKGFKSIDAIEIIPEDLFWHLLFYTNLDVYGEKPRKSKLYVINPGKNYKNTKFQCLPDFYKKVLNLDNDFIKIEGPIILEKNRQIVKNILSKMNIQNNLIYIVPTAGSLNWKELSELFWIKIADKYSNLGYEVIFNSKEKNYGKYKTLYLPAAQMVPLAESCKKVILFRSGLADLIASHKSDNVVVIYPKKMSHPNPNVDFISGCKLVYQFNEAKSDNDNMYKLFSLKSIIGDNRATEIIFDGNENNLQQLLLNEVLKDAK